MSDLQYQFVAHNRVNSSDLSNRIDTFHIQQLFDSSKETVKAILPYHKSRGLASFFASSLHFSTISYAQFCYRNQSFSTTVSEEVDDKMPIPEKADVSTGH